MEKNTYTFTPTYSTILPVYSLEKYGNFVSFNIAAVYLGSISANTWANVGTIPLEITPSETTTVMCLLSDGDSGQIKGYGKCEIQNTGNVRVKVNANQSLPAFTANFLWIK